MNIGKPIKTKEIVGSIYVGVRDIVNHMDTNPSTKRMSDLTWRIVLDTINISKINEIR